MNLQDDANKRQSIHMNSVPRGSWASSIFDLKSSQGDQLLPHLFDQVSYEQIDEENKKSRQENREDTLFSLYPGEEEVRFWIRIILHKNLVLTKQSGPVNFFQNICVPVTNFKKI